MIETHKFHLLAYFALALCIAGVRADVVYIGCDDGTIRKYGANGVGSLIGTNDIHYRYAEILEDHCRPIAHMELY